MKKWKKSNYYHLKINIKLFLQIQTKVYFRSIIYFCIEYDSQNMSKNRVWIQIEIDKKLVYIKYLNENNQHQNFIQIYKDIEYLFLSQIM